ncbi:DnaJ-like protein subfamily C member 19 [Nematocida major]|uniref:DnaJ-like protein subfamily C member 19 n=1 Tax=Nematocida major TaxID=1912982 RepID=UPI002007AACB|nr:DnaJ-like protein subfamily C member 19 [Nematocida major]KAH9386540.1 DnaJ-like protein subfamily C member 19 [Nematocida major]
MTIKEAMRILGVDVLTAPTIDTNYRALLRRNHPDLGGSEYLSQKINEAREMLMSRVK